MQLLVFQTVMAFLKARSHAVGQVSEAGDGGLIGITEVTEGIFF